MRRAGFCTLAGVMIPSACGCSPLSLATGGFKEVRGAHGKVVPVRDAPEVFYASLSSINIGEVTNTILPVCPAEMHAMVEQALRAGAEGASADLEGSGQSCTVNLDLTFNKAPGGAMALVGKGALLIGRADVRDAQAESQADLLVVVSSQAVRTKEQEMADAFAGTLIGYLREAGD